jgi:hypothetical protein
MLKRLIITGMLITSISFIFSCSDENNPVTPKTQKEAKELGIREITPPEKMKQSADPHAQMCIGYIGLANGFKNYTAMSQPPKKTVTAKTIDITENWTQTWIIDQLTVTMKYFENNVSFGWKIFLTGKDNQFTYSNWLSMEAEQKQDNSYGYLIIYKPVTTQVEFKWEWSQTQSVNNFMMETYDDNGNLISKIEVTTNNDNSGSLVFYDNSNGPFAKRTKITWTADGSGHWIDYNTSGNIINQGDF